MAVVLGPVKAKGYTNADVLIASVTVNFNSDGSWTFTDAQGDQLIYRGDYPEVNKLLELMFVGTGGFAAGTKLFGYA